MSADLFAEFGDPEPKKLTTTQATTTNEVPEIVPKSHIYKYHLSDDAGNGDNRRYGAPATIKDVSVINSDEGDIDDFGDFEIARPGSAASPGDSQTGLGIVHSANIHHLNDLHLAERSWDKSVPSSSRDPDVLFDMDDPAEGLWQEQVDLGAREEFDDFGDFENATIKTTRSGKAHTGHARNVTKKQAGVDLLGLDAGSPPEPNSVRATRGSPIPKTTKATTSTHAVTNTLPIATEDSWDDFESAPIVAAPSAVTHDTRAGQATPLSIPEHLVATMSDPSPTGQSWASLTTIPPPSVVITLFPPLFNEISSSFLQPLSSMAQAEKSAELLSPVAMAFLHSYSILSTVFAHVIAGRRQRWKRDKHLVQSMSIGPSVSGRSGGMKLAGVDKSETGREDREVVDALRTWKANVGRLRSVVSAFNSAATTAISKMPHPDGSLRLLPQVPDLMETMPVRTAKPSEGAVVSLHACALCGLKREERVSKVDVDIEDSFGEWWIDGTHMHLSCLNFWEGNKQRLRSR